MYATLLLIIVLAVFHRPILRAVIRWVGPKAAASLNLPLSWQVEGSLWGDFKFANIETGGGEGHWLPVAKIGELSATYDWRLLKKGDLEHAVNRVTLHDVEAELDLGKLPASKKAEPASAKEKTPGKLPIVWPRTIDIKNVNAAITLADGGKLIVRGLTLQIGEGMPGILECREIRREPGDLALENIKADVVWESRRITIQNLTLPKAVVLERLAVNLQGLWETDASAAVDMQIGLGAARLGVEASASGLLQPPLLFQAKIQGRDLRSEELHTLGLPKDVFFENGTLDLQAAGDALKPVELGVDVAFSLANIRSKGATIDAVSMKATVKDGRAEVMSLQINRTENRLDLTAVANLPADVKDLATSPWTASLQGSLPKVTDFLDQPPQVLGKLMLNATAEGKGSVATKAQGELMGESLAFQTYKLTQLRTLFSLDGKQASVEIPGLELGVGNSITLNATMQMEDAMPVKASWQIRVSDPSALMKTTGLTPPPEPVAGVIELIGKASFNIQDLSAKNYNGLLADMNLSVNQGGYGEGRIQELSLRTHVEKGSAFLDSADVRFDAENVIKLTGQTLVLEPYTFQAKGDINMAQLTSLNSWLRTFKAPLMESGGLNGDLNITGRLQPWQCVGKVNLNASAVKTVAMPEAATLALETAFEGTVADLKHLEATLGPWRLAVKGTVDEKQARLAELKVWQNKTELVSGSATIPFDLTKADGADGQPMQVSLLAKDLRVDEILAAAGITSLPSGILNADIRVNGRLETAEGRIFVELKNVKVPNGPKAFQPATLRSETVLENKRIRTRSTFSQPPLQTLTAEGDLPLDLPALIKSPGALNDTPLNFRLQMPESDLSFLREYAPDMIRSIPGRLKLDAKIAGTVGKPVLTGGVDLDIKEVAWSKPDLPSVRSVRALIRANGQKVEIQEVSAVLAGGRVKLSGAVDATDVKNPGLNLSLEAREALVFRDPTTSVRANADITCRGTLQQSTVAGLVEVVRGRVFKEIDLLPVLKLPVDVPPVPVNTGRSEAKLTLPPIIKDWLFNVKVLTRDPVLISGNLASGAVSADVRLSGTGASPQLTGGANIDRLLLKLPFSTVKVTKGVVTLRPAHPFDPDLDIRGESRMGSYDITLYIYGDSTNPKTRFTSSPPMSESDIVTMLATGTTLDGSASELASEAATRAAFLFLSEFYRKTFNKKKVVREEPPRLNMTFNPSGADRSNDSVQASYDLSENWRVTGRFTQTGRMKALLGYVLRFGKAARAMDERPESSLASPATVSPMADPVPSAPEPPASAPAP
ncbi:autotransporter translocation and assembly factor TamB [Prosthecobacter fusiformis]|uniref:Autotransporter translocation and assembly factor TamB n=1 Tax=Prosthecobacter fusiformis TaxID=48464 RepID=A0A4R7S0J1_9BACT|nr:autotransporter translocation and assembly factor TamB [Prosthecobacter fusiformis]